MYQHRVHLESGRLYLNGHAKGLLGTLNQPTWKGCVSLRPSGMVFSQQSVVCLCCGEWNQKLIRGPSEQRTSEQGTLSSHPQAEDVEGWMRLGRCGQLVCLEGSLSLSLLFTKLLPSLLSLNFPICKRSIIMVPTSWSSCGDCKRSFK